MRIAWKISGAAVACTIFGTAPLLAQDTELPEIALQHIQQADEIAGDDKLLQIMRTYHCYYVDPEDAQFRPSPRERNDLLFGTKFLDNVWYLGYMNIGMFVIETTEGLILVDGGADPDDGPKILKWLVDNGFTTDDIAYVIVTHEHGDHYGGIPFLKSVDPDIKLIVGSAAEWDEEMAEFAPFDMEIDEQTELTVGETNITLVPTPGHTPGTISAFIDVQVDGEERVASFWGGKGMRPNVENLEIMVDSVATFSALSEELNATVPLNTHGWGDATVSRMIDQVLMPEMNSPFVMTETQAASNNEILNQCTVAYLEAVRAGGIK
ncbi:MBL fold metallo-hydrolase [Alloyangia pacifica]|uniref:MBL fold metallo-hydrolase n=1 Tax=Alloyangia pacifica TaxID=311180 RepID=UPI0031E33853